MQQHKAVALHIAGKHNNLYLGEKLLDLADEKAQILPADNAFHKKQRRGVPVENGAQLTQQGTGIGNRGKHEQGAPGPRRGP